MDDECRHTAGQSLSGGSSTLRPKSRCKRASVRYLRTRKPDWLMLVQTCGSPLTSSILEIDGWLALLIRIDTAVTVEDMTDTFVITTDNGFKRGYDSANCKKSGGMRYGLRGCIDSGYCPPEMDYRVWWERSTIVTAKLRLR
jgi:hypothetical protein